MLDEGWLTDGKRKTVDFTNTVIIRISNLGAQERLEASSEEGGHNIEDRKVHSQVMTVTRGNFSPEFLIALAIIVFDSFGAAQLEKIVQKAMKSVKKKQLEEQSIQIVLQKSGVNVILEASYGKAYGTCSA